MALKQKALKLTKEIHAETMETSELRVEIQSQIQVMTIEILSLNTSAVSRFLLRGPITAFRRLMR